MAGVERLLVASGVLAGRLLKCLLPGAGWLSNEASARQVLRRLCGSKEASTGPYQECPRPPFPFGFPKEEPWC